MLFFNRIETALCISTNLSSSSSLLWITWKTFEVCLILSMLNVFHAYFHQFYTGHRRKHNTFSNKNSSEYARIKYPDMKSQIELYNSVMFLIYPAERKKWQHNRIAISIKYTIVVQNPFRDPPPSHRISYFSNYLATLTTSFARRCIDAENASQTLFRRRGGG